MTKNWDSKIFFLRRGPGYLMEGEKTSRLYINTSENIELSAWRESNNCHVPENVPSFLSYKQARRRKGNLYIITKKKFIF